MDKHSKQFLFKAKSIDEANMIIDMVGTTSDVDRVGDIVIASGVDYSDYMHNPIVLPNHDYSSEAIGKTLSITPKNESLVFKIQFASTTMGREWFYLYSNGFMSSSSIGFIPIEYKPNDSGGYTYTKIQLLEISLVTVPCQQNANILRAFEDGKISKALFDAINKESEVEEMKVEEVKALIDKSVKAEVKTLEDKHKEEVAAKEKEIEGLNEKVKELESLVNEKAGAKLSQATCDCLTKACAGISEHVKNIKGLIDVVNTQETDGESDDGDTKDYSQEDINKAVKANIEKILGGNE